MLIAIVIFLILLSVLVFIHEFGHFIMAKRAGIGVDEFGMGLPPRIFGKKIGETIYSLNLLPFGGFVKLVGEDPTDERRQLPNSFHLKPVNVRISVVLAGVVMNFLFGILLFYVILGFSNFRAELPLLFEHKFRFVSETKQVAVVLVQKDSPAEKSGLKVGEIILTVDGETVSSADRLRELVSDRGGKETNLLLRTAGKNDRREVSIVPRNDKEKGALGVSLSEVAILEYKTLPQKIFSGFSHAANTIEYSARIFGSLTVAAVNLRSVEPLSSGVAGPVGIAQLTNEVVSLGLLPTLQFAALLSLNLAVLNVLPLPALDGGRLLFLIIEGVFRKRVYPAFEKWVNTIGFAALLLLILVITANDIQRLLSQSGLLGR